MKLDPDLFWARIEKFEGCWFFDGNANRYGMYTDEFGFKHVAHRLAYMLGNGPIPFGYVILHACDTPGCCNPEHLTADTHTRNMQDKAAKGRSRLPSVLTHRGMPPVIPAQSPAPTPPLVAQDEPEVDRSPLLRPAAVADELRISEAMLKEMIKRNQIAYYRLGGPRGVVRISRMALDKFIATSTDNRHGAAETEKSGGE